MRRGPREFGPHPALILLMALVATAPGAQEADEGAGRPEWQISVGVNMQFMP